MPWRFRAASCLFKKTVLSTTSLPFGSTLNCDLRFHCVSVKHTWRSKIGESKMFSGRIVQIFLLSVGIITQLSVLSYAATPLAEHFKYVADAVNQINFLVAKSLSPGDNAKEIVEQSCEMLTQLVSDGTFKELVYKGFRPTVNADLRNMLSDLARVNDLVNSEQRALQNIGIDHLTSIQVLAAALPLAKTIDAEKINAELILKDISDLKDRSCLLTGEIERNEKRAVTTSAVELGVAGVAIVVADGVASYYSAGLAEFLVSVSYPIGGGMVVEGLHDLSKP